VTTVHDVAAYILKAHGSMTTMKLEKLVYYAQAWSLVWDDEPLFAEPIEAWANGPVAPDLYREHAGQFQVASLPKGKAEALTQEQRDTVDAVLRAYGDKSSQWLSDLTHSEEPWRAARRGLRPGERGSAIITHAAMAEYYASLSEETAQALG
jgi:uncharacterized phage-associated protein